MQCEKCGAVVSPDSISCQECGAPLLQNIRDFPNTMEIQSVLRTIVVEHGTRAVSDRIRFFGLLDDFIPDYERERKLLINMCKLGVFKILLEEKNKKIAVMKAKNYMISDLFLSESATEFVLACLTYLLGWPYESDLKVITDENDDEVLVKDTKPEPKHRVSIDDNVFRPIDAVRFRLRGNIVIPEGYTKIESFCFDGFGSLRTIELPSSLLAIGEYAFSACKRLRGVELPESLKLIKQGAFCQCAKLAMIKMPKGVLEIEDSTFSFCTSLEVVDVPDTVSSIGAEAFSGCEKLRKLFLPESIKFIDVNAFSYCPNLTIYCIENSYVHKYCLTNRINAIIVKSRAELIQ